MKLAIKKATADVSVYLFIQNSSLTTGAGLTGLVFDSASLVCYYVRPLAAAAALTLATQTVTGAHSDGGFVEVDATNMPGVYRLDLSDAVCATGVNSVVVMLKGAANMAPVLLEIQLVAYDPNDAIHLGLSALPNAAADAAGGLAISDAGGLDLDGLATSAEIAALNDLSAAQVNAEADQALADYDPPTRAELTSDTNSILSKLLKYFQLALRKDAAIATDNGTELTAINADGGSGAGAFDNTTEALEAIRDRGDAAWLTATSVTVSDKTGFSLTAAYDPAKTAAQAGDAMALTSGERTTLAAAIWNALTSGMTTVGSIGKKLADWVILTAAAVNAEVDTALADYDGPTRAEATSDTNSILSKLLKYFQISLRKDAAIATDNGTELTAINADGGSGAGAFDNTTEALEAIRDRGDAAWTGGGAAPTAAEVADAVWDETLADHLGAGSTGAGLNAAGSAGDPWATALPGAYGAGSAGKIVGDNLNATVGSRLPTSSYTAPDNSGIAAIKAKTDQMVFTIANKLDSSIQAAGDFAQAAADKVWASAARTLTSYGTLVADSAAAVWAAATRTLTAFGFTPADTAGTTTLLSRLTSTRAGYLDNLSGGPVALAAGVTLTAGQIAVKKNTALAAFGFPMFDETTGDLLAGLTVTAQRRINGGAFVACANAPTEVSDGFYSINLAAADLNGDTIILKFTATGAKVTAITLVTQP